MTLRATRTIGTGEGWDLTDSGIYLPDWAGLDDVRPGRSSRTLSASQSASTCSRARAASPAASSRRAGT